MIASVVASAGATEMLLVWFGLMIVGVLAIGYVLQEGVRKGDDKSDPSVHHLTDPRDLPLVAVRDALRPKPKPKQPTEDEVEAMRERRHRRRRRRTPRNPNGPRLVK